MIKLSDYIIKNLKEYGIKHIFMVSGGGAMHLNDSIGKYKDIEYICNHHEQACAIGAEGYARTGGKLAVVNVTTGPGGTNAITGLIGQWLDSVPVLYISGQVKFETCIESCKEIGLRQLGDQEINIIDIVKPVTKFASMIKNPLEVKRLLKKAIYIATHGRPGPVWLDIPLDIQGSMIDESLLIDYNEDEDRIEFNNDEINLKISEIIKLLQKSERPVFIAGHGIRIAGGEKLFLKVVEKLNIPVVTTFNGFDLIPSNHRLFSGRLGTVGDRAGNFTVQNSDLLISAGSRNNIRQISYNWECYGREAKKIIIDIDEAELKKPTVKPFIALVSDAKYFLEELQRQLEGIELPDFRKWVAWSMERKQLYPVVLPEYKTCKETVDSHDRSVTGKNEDLCSHHLSPITHHDSHINPYYFIQVLTECLARDSIVVAGNGTACVALFQAGIVKEGQRIFWNSGCAGMGYDLPAAIGACFAGDKKNVICLAGDGSLQMNIQELQTVVYHRLPVKIFYLNNKGYISIKQTQDNFFGGRYVACNESSGVSFPDITKIACAYGMNTEIIDRHEHMRDKIESILRYEGPLMCDVMLQTDYIFSPKLSSERKPDGRIISKPLEDLYPFLPREEFYKNMIIKPLDE